MSLRDDVMNSVYQAMQEAAQQAEDEWKKSPAFRDTAMLTDKNIDMDSNGVSCEMVFETHRRTLPQVSRDMYGVAKGPARAYQIPAKKNANPEKLMQSVTQTMEDTFADALTDRLRTI